MIILPPQQEEPDNPTLRSTVIYLHAQTHINHAFSPAPSQFEIPSRISCWGPYFGMFKEWVIPLSF